MEPHLEIQTSCSGLLKPAEYNLSIPGNEYHLQAGQVVLGEWNEEVFSMRKIFLSLLICALFANPVLAAMSDADFLELFKYGTLQQINEAIRGGVNVNARDADNKTPLHWAVWAARWNPNLEVIAAIRVLAEAGADVNAKDVFGGTPLIQAALNYPNLELITALIEAGADVNAEGSPLFSAAQSTSNPEVVVALIEAGANVSDAALVGAVLNGNPEAIEIIMTLIKAGANVNARFWEWENRTPLMLAARYNHNSEVITALLEAGADPTIRDENNEMAIDFARENSWLRNTSVLRILAEATSASEPLFAALIGTWATNFAGNEVELTFRSDGTYSSRSGGVTIEGTFSVEGNRVTTSSAAFGEMTEISEIETDGDVLTSRPIRVVMGGNDITAQFQGMSITYRRVR